MIRGKRPPSHRVVVDPIGWFYASPRRLFILTDEPMREAISLALGLLVLKLFLPDLFGAVEEVLLKFLHLASATLDSGLGF